MDDVQIIEANEFPMAPIQTQPSLDGSLPDHVKEVEPSFLKRTFGSTAWSNWISTTLLELSKQSSITHVKVSHSYLPEVTHYLPKCIGTFFRILVTTLVIAIIEGRHERVVWLRKLSHPDLLSNTDVVNTLSTLTVTVIPRCFFLFSYLSL